MRRHRHDARSISSGTVHSRVGACDPRDLFAKRVLHGDSHHALAIASLRYGPVEAPITDCPVLRPSLWPRSHFVRDCFELGAPGATLRLPQRRSAPFPVCRRRHCLVCRIGTFRPRGSALDRFLRLLRHGTSLHLLRHKFRHSLPHCLHKLCVAGCLVQRCSAPGRGRTPSSPRPLADRSSGANTAAATKS